jgi:hypothetical protein
MTDPQFGIEFEVPLVETGTFLESRGYSSRGLYDALQQAGWRHHPPADAGLDLDPTVGAEIVSDPLPPRDASHWYSEMWDAVKEMGYDAQPCGQLADGPTAGLHIHMSSFGAETMDWLHGQSSEGWLQAFACSSVCERHGGVFRGESYCDLSSHPTRQRYKAVNQRSARRGHYEWRLPEPALPSHVGKLTKFLDTLHGGNTREAKEYAISQMRKNPDSITAVRRHKEVHGTNCLIRQVTTEPRVGKTGWFESVRDDSRWYDPQIVELYDGPTLYAVGSPLSKNTVKIPGSVTPTHGDETGAWVLVYADTLEPYHGPHDSKVIEVCEGTEKPTDSALSFIEKEVLK